MSLPKLDSFTGANGALHTYDANWTDLFSTTLSISGNKVTAGGPSCGIWTGDTFNDDQYAQCVTDATSRGGPAARGRQAGDSTADWYMCYVDQAVSGDLRLYKIVDGSLTLINNFGTLAAAATWRLEAQGSSLRIYKNGVQQGSTQTDTAIATGSAGVTPYSGGTFDDFEGGNLAVASPFFFTIGASHRA